ncbi:hypothetical protein HZA97_05770 [Candidatus Woesearchaeota archaeon]|nr:hypothetical protein [Candidatus Woesearchaeota archaeon]
MSLSNKLKFGTALGVAGLVLYGMECTGLMKQLQNPELNKVDTAWVGDGAKVLMIYGSYAVRFGMDAFFTGLAGLTAYKGLSFLEDKTKQVYKKLNAR